MEESRKITLKDELKLNKSMASKTLILLIRLERGKVGFLLKPFRVVIMNFLFNTEIPPSVKVGKPLRVPHPYGIIVNSNSTIGAGCTIYHNVTLGADDLAEKYGSPNLGDYCFIGAGVSLIGDIEIGNNVIIAVNSLVTKSIESNKYCNYSGKIVDNKFNVRGYINKLLKRSKNADEKK